MHTLKGPKTDIQYKIEKILKKIRVVLTTSARKRQVYFVHDHLGVAIKQQRY